MKYALPCLVLLAAASHFSTAQIFITPDSREAYIHTAAADSSLTAVPINLSSIGVGPGDYLRIRAFGAFSCGPCPDNQTNTIAVFSSTPDILSPTLLHRIPGAIEAGLDVVTENTFFGNEPTDIPQDFSVYLVSQNITEVRIAVPPTAAYLFITPSDSLYEDNFDPNGDYMYELTVICPGDFNLDGVADFFDVQAFLSSFSASDPIADLTADGMFDFFDVLAYLNHFAAGCP